jgi:hypothetical protein
VNGEQGYYLFLDINDESLLSVSSRVYKRPASYSPYSNNISVELKSLKTGEKYDEVVSIKLPAKETIPPFLTLLRSKKIIYENIKYITLTIGYFYEETGILDFLKKKSFGWFIDGEEILNTGKDKDKSFLEIQNLLFVNIPVKEEK